MLSILDYIILFLSGCVGGTIVGLLGVGGGVIYIFILSFYFDKLKLGSIESVRFLLSNSFFAIFFASIFGTIQQIRNKNFYLKEVLLTVSTAVIFSAGISILIINFDWYDKKSFTIFFVIILILMAVKMALTVKSKFKGFKDKLPYHKFPLIGMLMGIFSALSGLGGGVITVPLLSDISGLKIKKATSISLGVMPIMSLVSIIIYGLQQTGGSEGNALGYLYPQIVLPLALGAILMAPVGVKFANKISDSLIRIFFIIIILIVVLRMLLGML